MENLYKLSRVIFAFTTAIFGVMNLMNAEEMVGTVPSWLPGGTIWVYLVGILLLAIAGAVLMKTKARLAGFALAGLMVLFILTVYLPKVIAGDHTALTGLLKDILIGTGAVEFAKNQPID